MLSISLRAAYTLCNTTTDFRVLHIGTSIRVSKASFDAWLARIEEAYLWHTSTNAATANTRFEARQRQF